MPRAWKLVHGGGGDPHWFDYPSLLMYVNAPFQLWHDEPSYLTARIVGVALALGAIAASWWLGRRAYGTASAGVVAASVVAVCTIHVAYSRAAVTDVPLTLGVAVSLALLVTGRLELGGLAAGLAMGFKYPGVFLLVPLVVAGWKQWGRVAVSVGLAVVAFLASSPFILVHRHQAWHEAFRVQRLAREGWLGFEHDHIAPIAFTGRLWEGLGPVLIVCGVGLVLALIHRTRADLVLSSFVIVYFADLLTLSAHFDRYVLPLVPALGALAGRMRSLAPVTLLLLVVPLTWSVRDAKELTRTDTRVVAQRWVERNVSRGHADRRGPVDSQLRGASCAPSPPAGPEARVRPEPQHRPPPKDRRQGRRRDGCGDGPGPGRARSLSAGGSLLRRAGEKRAARLLRRARRRPGRAVGRGLPITRVGADA